MNNKILSAGMACIAIALPGGLANAYEATMGPAGLLAYDRDRAAGGYTLLQSSPARLIDMNGYLVHEWSDATGADAQLTRDGTLLRASPTSIDYGNPLQTGRWGGIQGRLREWNWDGDRVKWDIQLAGADWIAHHTFHRMPNGNTLVLIWERYSRDEAIAKGRDPSTVNPEGSIGDEPNPGVYTGDLWPDKIMEIKKCASRAVDCYDVVWEWRAWDHLCDMKSPDCIDINYHIPRPTDRTHRSSADFMHANGIDYDPVNDLVVLTSRAFGEFYLIDHATGDIVYRWGNPSAWDENAIAPSYMDDGDTHLFGPHGTNVAASEPGSISVLVFDNGWLRPSGSHSRVLQVSIDLHDKDYYAMPDWGFQTASPNSMTSEFVSYAERVDNGNTVITSGMEGHVLEVNNAGQIVWEYINPPIIDGVPQCEITNETTGANFMFRSYRYGTRDPAIRYRRMNIAHPKPYPDGCGSHYYGRDRSEWQDYYDREPDYVRDGAHGRDDRYESERE